MPSTFGRFLLNSILADLVGGVMSVAAVFSLDSTEPSFLVISVFIVAFVPSLIGIFMSGTSNLPFWIGIGVWFGSFGSYTLFYQGLG